MDEDSADDGEFSNIALCVCSAAESINASEDELAHIQVSINAKGNTFCHCDRIVHCGTLLLASVLPRITGFSNLQIIM